MRARIVKGPCNPQAFRAGAQNRSDPIRIISQNYPGLVKMEGAGDKRQRGVKITSYTAGKEEFGKCCRFKKDMLCFVV